MFQHNVGNFWIQEELLNMMGKCFADLATRKTLGQRDMDLVEDPEL